VNARRLTRYIWLGLVCLLLLALTAGCLIRPSKQTSDLSYNLPTKLTVPIGELVPGTDIRYVSMSETGAHIAIRGQDALKRKGDSVDWKGTPREGVFVDLKLRIVWYTEDELHLVGTAKITVEGVQPAEGSASTMSPISYGGPVVYSLARGAHIPGTTATFEGETEDGAELAGLEGYPYRKVGDSIYWEGALRDGVYLRLDVRALQFDEKALRVGGLATLWIDPS